VICGGRRWWQPCYWVLPDEGDCVALFGDKRHSKYVAQDNVELVHGAELRVYNEIMHGPTPNTIQPHRLL